MEGEASWSGVLLDTNAPDTESWWYRLAEQETPDGWEFFRQPAGNDPNAENIENLPSGYYERLKTGKDEDCRFTSVLTSDSPRQQSSLNTPCVVNG